MTEIQRDEGSWSSGFSVTARFLTSIMYEESIAGRFLLVWNPTWSSLELQHSGYMYFGENK